MNMCVCVYVYVGITMIRLWAIIDLSQILPQP